MTPPTLTPPRHKATHAQPPATPASPVQGPASTVQPRPDRQYDRVLKWGLVVSVLVHLLVLALSPLFIRIGLPPGQTDTPYEPIQTSGLRMLELATAESEPEEAPAEPQTAIPVPSQAAETELPVREESDPPPAEARDAAPEAERPRNPLLPGYSDPRLYVTPGELPPPPEPSRHERYMARLEARLDTYNDSIGAAAERARRATDWTYTDSDGKRWGVTPGKIHLGGVTLPLPIYLGGSGERQREAAEETRQREEIQRDEATRSQREVMEERIRATRERKDAEREQENAEEEVESPPPP